MRSDKESFLYGNIEKIPQSDKGVYAFWHRRRCIYVGKSDQSIRERLRQHWNGETNQKLRRWINALGKDLDICYLRIQSKHQIDRIERHFIKRWDPETNTQHRRK